MKKQFPWIVISISFCISLSAGLGIGYIKNSKPLKRKIKCFIGAKVSKEFLCTPLLGNKVANSFTYSTSLEPLSSEYHRSAGLISTFDSSAKKWQHFIINQDGKQAYSPGLKSKNLKIAEKNSDYIKAAFKFKKQYYGLLTHSSADCNQATLVNFTKQTTVLKFPCLPANEPVDWNGIGGGFTPYKNGFLLSLGVPETSSEIIRNLAQDKNSFYGKILFISPNSNDELEASVFSSGHRNPQGLTSYNGKVFAVEHGPRGGDELNEIKKGQNYGWPVVSFGINYQGPRNGVVNPPNMTLPIYSFVPSIGISDVTVCPMRLQKYYSPFGCLLLSSLRENALYVVILNEKATIALSIEKLPIGKRIREFQQELDSEQLKNSEDFFFISLDGGKIFKIHLKKFR